MRLAWLILLGVAWASVAATAVPPGTNGVAAAAEVGRDPETPREYYNYGARLLEQGDLSKAEQVLVDLLEQQEDKYRPAALYNLGHIRFRQGVKELQKGPKAAPTAERARVVTDVADQAIRTADEALGGKELDRLVAAYQQGRGARKELRSARKAVKQALDVLGNTLRRWERSSGDFKSTLELSSKDEDARHNAEVVDRSIAKLVDSLQQLQQMAAQMGQKNQDLGQKLKQLRGRIPDEDAPPGAAGEDEEEEEDKPNGQQEGQQEGPTKEGQEIPLTPEQAAALLEGFKLGDKRLPMGMESSKDQKRKGGEEY